MPAKDPRRPKGESGPAKSSTHLQRATTSGLYQDPSRLAALDSLLGGKGGAASSITGGVGAGGVAEAATTGSQAAAAATTMKKKGVSSSLSSSNRGGATSGMGGTSSSSAETMMTPFGASTAADNNSAPATSTTIFDLMSRITKKGTGETLLLRSIAALVAAYSTPNNTESLGSTTKKGKTASDRNNSNNNNNNNVDGAASDEDVCQTVSSFTAMLADGATVFHANPAVRRGLSLCISHLLSRSSDVRQTFGNEMTKAFAPWLCLCGDPSGDVSRPAVEALNNMFAPGSAKRSQLFSKFGAKAAKKLFEELAKWTAHRSNFVGLLGTGTNTTAAATAAKSNNTTTATTTATTGARVGSKINDDDDDVAATTSSNHHHHHHQHVHADPADSACGGAASQVLGALSILFSAEMAPATRLAIAPVLGFTFGEDATANMGGATSSSSSNAIDAAGNTIGNSAGASLSAQPLSFVARKAKNKKRAAGAAAGAAGAETNQDEEEVEGSAVFGPGTPAAAAAAASSSPVSPFASLSSAASSHFGLLTRLLPSSDEGARQSVFAHSHRLRSSMWALAAEMIIFIARAMADAKNININNNSSNNSATAVASSKKASGATATTSSKKKAAETDVAESGEGYENNNSNNLASLHFSLGVILRSVAASIFEDSAASGLQQQQTAAAEPQTAAAATTSSSSSQQKTLWACLISALHTVHQLHAASAASSKTAAVVDAASVASCVRSVLWPSIIDVLDNCAEGDLGDQLPEALLDAVSPLMLLLRKMERSSSSNKREGEASASLYSNESSSSSSSFMAVFHKLVKITMREQQQSAAVKTTSPLAKYATAARALLEFVGSALSLLLSEPEQQQQQQQQHATTPVTSLLLQSIFDIAQKQLPAFFTANDDASAARALAATYVVVGGGGKAAGAAAVPSPAIKMLFEVADKIAGWRLLAAKFSQTSPAVSKSILSCIDSNAASASTSSTSFFFFFAASLVHTVRRWLTLDAANITPEMHAEALRTVQQFQDLLKCNNNNNSNNNDSQTTQQKQQQQSAFLEVCCVWLVNEWATAAAAAPASSSSDDRVRLVAAAICSDSFQIMDAAMRSIENKNAAAAESKEQEDNDTITATTTTIIRSLILAFNFLFRITAPKTLHLEPAQRQQQSDLKAAAARLFHSSTINPARLPGCAKLFRDQRQTSSEALLDSFISASLAALDQIPSASARAKKAMELVSGFVTTSTASATSSSPSNSCAATFKWPVAIANTLLSWIDSFITRQQQQQVQQQQQQAHVLNKADDSVDVYRSILHTVVALLRASSSGPSAANVCTDDGNNNNSERLYRMQREQAVSILQKLGDNALLPLASAPSRCDFALFVVEETVHKLAARLQKVDDSEAEEEEEEEDDFYSDDDSDEAEEQENDEVINDEDDDDAIKIANNENGSSSSSDDEDEGAARYSNLQKSRDLFHIRVAMFLSLFDLWAAACELIPGGQGAAIIGTFAATLDKSITSATAAAAAASGGNSNSNNGKSSHMAALAASVRAGSFPSLCASPDTWNNLVLLSHKAQQPSDAAGSSSPVFSLTDLLLVNNNSSSSSSSRISVHDFDVAYFPEATVRNLAAANSYLPDTLADVARIAVCLAEALFAAGATGKNASPSTEYDDDDDDDDHQSYDDGEEEEEENADDDDDDNMNSADLALIDRQQQHSGSLVLPDKSVGAALLLPVMQIMVVRNLWTPKVKESLRYIFNWCMDCVFSSPSLSSSAQPQQNNNNSTINTAAVAALATSCVSICMKSATRAPFLLTGPLALLAQLHGTATSSPPPSHVVGVAAGSSGPRRQSKRAVTRHEKNENDDDDGDEAARETRRKRNNISSRLRRTGEEVMTLEEAEASRPGAATAAATSVRAAAASSSSSSSAVANFTTSNYERLLRAIYGAVANAWVMGDMNKAFSSSCFSPWPGSAFDDLLWRALMPRGISLPAPVIEKLRRALGAPVREGTDAVTTLSNAVTAMQLLALLPESVAASSVPVEANHVVAAMRAVTAAAKGAAAAAAAATTATSSSIIYTHGLGVFAALSRCGNVAPAALPEVAAAAVNCLTQSYRLEMLPPAGKFQFQQRAAAAATTAAPLYHTRDPHASAAAASTTTTTNASSSAVNSGTQHRQMVQALAALRHGVKAHFYQDDPLTSAMNLCVLDMGCALGAKLQKMALDVSSSPSSSSAAAAAAATAADPGDEDAETQHQIELLLLEAYDVSSFLSSDFLSSSDLRALRASAATVDPVARFVLGTHFWLCSRPIKAFEDDEFVAKAVTIVNLSAQLAVSILIGCRPLCENDGILQSLVAVFSRSPLRALPARAQVVADINKRLAELTRVSGLKPGSPSTTESIISNGTTIANPRRQIAELLAIPQKAVNLSSFRRHASYLMQSAKSRVTAVSYFTLAYVFISLTDDPRAAALMSTTGLVQVADAIMCCLTIKDSGHGGQHMLLLTTSAVAAAPDNNNNSSSMRKSAKSSAASGSTSGSDDVMSPYLEIATVADPKWLQPAARSSNNRGAAVSAAQLRSHCGRWAAALLGLLLQRPVLLTLRAWIDSLHPTAKEPITQFVNSHFSPFLARMSMLDVIAHAPASAGDMRQLMEAKTCSFRAPADLGGDAVHIVVDHKMRRISIAYMTEEIETSLSIQVPIGFPLNAPRIEDRDIGIKGIAESKRRSWLLRMSTSLLNGSSSLWDAVSLFCKNLAREFEGVEPCPICYMITSNNELPNMSCRVCKNAKFHRGCLQTWWGSSSQSATCPMCRSPWFAG